MVDVSAHDVVFNYQKLIRSDNETSTYVVMIRRILSCSLAFVSMLCAAVLINSRPLSEEASTKKKKNNE